MHSLPDFPVSIPWMIAWIIVLVIALAGFVQMLIALNRNGHRKIIGLVFAVLFVLATAFHVVLLSRSSHTVTDGNWVQLALISSAASLEMFLGQTVVFDDIIAAVIFREPLLLLIYVTLFFFIISYTLTVLLLIMPRRLRDRTWLMMNAHKVRKSEKNHIFLGVDKRAKTLAKTILKNLDSEKNRGEVILVDFPDADSHLKEISIGDLFTNIFSHRQELSLEDELGSPGFVLLRAHAPEGGDTVAESIGLKKLEAWLESPSSTIYILSQNEEENFELLKRIAAQPEIKAKVFCYTKRVNSYTSLIASMGDRIRLLNPPEMSFMAVRQHQPELHPIHYADIARNAAGEPLGYVRKAYSAMVIGFGEAGQEALRYLWEFGSFVGEDKKPLQNTYYVYDPDIDQIKGDFLNRTPALRYGADINWSPVTIGSSQFWLEYAMTLPSLSYVVISVDRGPRNMEIAVRLLQEAARYGKDLSRMCILVRAWGADQQMLDLIQFYNRCYCPEGVSVIHPYGVPESIWNLDVITGKSLKHQSVQYAALMNRESWEARSERIRSRGGNPLLNRQELHRKQAGDIGRSLFAHTLQTLCPPSLYPLADGIPDQWDPEHPVHYNGKKADGKILEYLAVGEHLHWMTALQAAGYIDGNGEQDELNKRILNLVPYEDIQEESARHLAWLSVKTSLLMAVQKLKNEQENG